MFQTKKETIFSRWGVPTGLFVFALTTRFLLIGKGLYHPDAVTFLLKAQELARSGQLHGYLTGYNLPVILGALFLRMGALLGIDGTTSLNMLSVVCSAATIPIFYILCFRLFDRMTALMSSFVVLCLPHLLALSTFANSQIVALPFLLLGLCMLVGEGEKGESFWVLAAVFFGMAGASRPQDLIFMIPGICFLLWAGGALKEIGARRVFMFWGIMAVTVVGVPLPFLFYNGTFPDIARFRSLFVAYLVNAPDTLNQMFPMFLFSINVYYNEFQYRLIFVLLGAVFLFQQSRVYFVFLVIWFFSTFIGYTMTFHKIMPMSRYLLLSFLPVVICAGYGIRTLYEGFSAAHVRGLKWALLMCIFLSFFSKMPAIISVLSLRHDVALGENFGRWVGHLTPPEAVVITSDEREFIANYGHRRIENPSRHEYALVIKRCLEKGTPLFLVSPLEPRTMILSYQKQGYRLIPIGRAPFEFWVTPTLFQVHDEILYRVERLSPFPKI